MSESGFFTGSSCPNGTKNTFLRFRSEPIFAALPLKPSLVPLESSDTDCKSMQGLSLKNVSLKIIDNNSNKEEESYLYLDKLAQYINVTVIKSDENLGFAKANNRGMEIAKGRNFLILNPDVVMHNNIVKVLSDYLDNNEKNVKKWLEDPEAVKEGNKMTGTYGELTDSQIDALTKYLETLSLK